MNHVWTVLLLIIFSMLTITTHYVGKPIRCWLPAHFTEAWKDYTHNVCWISNTYYVPTTDTIPTTTQSRGEKEITYYQWTPIILLLLALMFKAPNLLWNSFNVHAGINLDKLAQIAVDTQWTPPQKQDGAVDDLACNIHQWIRIHRANTKSKFYKLKLKLSQILFFVDKKSGNFLTYLFIAIKVMYCINAISVFYVLNHHMAFEFSVLGYEMLEHFVQTGEMKEIPLFPRVTLCDFEIRQQQNVNPYTVQCVLPVNLFNEKIFIILWFWFFFVACCTFGSLFAWINWIISQIKEPLYVEKYLLMADLPKNKNANGMWKDFVTNYLRLDGVLVLKMLENNSSKQVVSDIILNLYKRYQETGLENRR